MFNNNFPVCLFWKVIFTIKLFNINFLNNFLNLLLILFFHYFGFMRHSTTIQSIFCTVWHGLLSSDSIPLKLLFPRSTLFKTFTFPLKIVIQVLKNISRNQYLEGLKKFKEMNKCVRDKKQSSCLIHFAPRLG